MSPSEWRKEVLAPARIAHIAAVVLLGVLSMSCQLLVAPKNGRWNPDDPNNTLVAKTAELKPVEDGYVNQADGAYHGNEAYLQVSCSAASMQNLSLLKFDLSQVPISDPKWLRGAQLVLYCDRMDTADYVVIYPIQQAWDSSVRFSTASASTFIDNTIDIGGPLTIGIGVENRYDIFPILQAWFTGLPNYGLRLHGDPNFYVSSTLFFSSDSPVHPPRLLVTYLVAE